MPLAANLTNTSPAFGGSSSISSTLQGVLRSHKMAALVFISRLPRFGSRWFRATHRTNLDCTHQTVGVTDPTEATNPVDPEAVALQRGDDVLVAGVLQRDGEDCLGLASRRNIDALAGETLSADLQCDPLRKELSLPVVADPDGYLEGRPRSRAFAEHEDRVHREVGRREVTGAEVLDEDGKVQRLDPRELFGEGRTGPALRRGPRRACRA